MAIVATGQTTIIDFSDGKSLNAHLGTNTPKTQILDVNNAGGTYTPNWASSNVTITPFIYVNQQVIDPTDSAIGIEWKRREGVGSEAVLVSGETMQGDKSLKITQNKLGDSPSKLLTYIAKISYTDPDTAQTIHIEADITFSMVTTGENAKSAWISGDQVFKYAAGASTPTPASITLTANLQNVTMNKWQYKNSSGNWVNFSPAQTGATINITPDSAAFNGSTASIQLVTNDPNVGDTTSIYKVSDGIAGGPGQDGAAGLHGLTAIVSNEAHAFPAAYNGAVSTSNYAGSGTTIRLFEGATELDYDGTGTANGKWKVSLTATGITAGSLTDSGNYLTVGQHSAMANATEAASISYNIIGKRATGGAINLTVMQTFTKAKQGNVGQNAVVLTIYSENGNTFENGAGADKTLKVNAYDGSTEITSGNATWKWTKLPSATSIGSGNTLTVQASDVTGMAVYKLEMTYPKTGGKKYYDTFTIVDKTDNYQAEIQSTGGNIFKNTQGNTILTCRVYQNGVEVDAPKSAIAQASNPSGGTSGQFYYKILTTGAIPRTTILMKYTTSWGNAPGGDQHTLTYNWYRWDSEGTAMDGGAIWAVGKCVYAGPEDVDNKTTFYCEVNK